MGQAEDLGRRSGLLVPLQEAFRSCIVVESDLDTGGFLIPSGGDCTAAESVQGIPGADLHLILCSACDPVVLTLYGLKPLFSF